MIRLGLKHWKGSQGNGWMSYLPTGIKIEAIPFVLLDRKDEDDVRKRLATEGLYLAWSTMFLMEGHHHPKRTTVKALTQPGEGWWKTHDMYGKVKA